VKELEPTTSLMVFADDWGRHPSSCQHLVRHLQDQFKVLWINTIGTRKPRVTALTARRVVEKLRNWSKGLQQISDRFWVCDLPMLPAAGGRIGQALNQKWISHRLQSLLAKAEISRPVVFTTLPYVHGMVRNITRRGMVYYCTDDFSHWPDADRDALVAADREISAQADLVLPVSQSLYERYRNCRRCEFFPHGVDFEHFAAAASLENDMPESLHRLPRPRIGFFGLIYEKLDFELLSAVSRRYPSGSVVMIGPVDYCDNAFRALPNVQLMGRQPYSDLPRWIAGLDALMLPYVDDPMIRQSGPLKLRECLASGKPTVSVAVPEVRRLEPHVRVAEDIDGFLNQIDQALAEATDSPAKLLRQNAVRDDSWAKRARHFENLIATL
jgi:glycosyltransferase involved in cell wall biosynthesis